MYSVHLHLHLEVYDSRVTETVWVLSILCLAGFCRVPCSSHTNGMSVLYPLLFLNNVSELSLQMFWYLDRVGICVKESSVQDPVS